MEESRTATPFVFGAWAADFDARLAAAATRSDPLEPLISIAWLVSARMPLTFLVGK